MVAIQVDEQDTGEHGHTLIHLMIRLAYHSQAVRRHIERDQLRRGIGDAEDAAVLLEKRG